MAIRPNRYNDPALGAAFENIASLFAPMSGSDMAGYAAADVNRQKAMAEAQRVGLIDMFAQGGNDRLGVAAGLYAPNQSYYAVDQGNATTRRGQNLSYQLGTENNQRDNATTARGQDLTFRSSTENNIRDNGARIYGADQALRGDVLGTMMKPVGEGEVRPALSPEMAQWIGIPTGIEPVEGRQKPLTEDQVAGAALQDARDQGLYTPQNAADARIYDGTPVQVTGPNGAPVYADPTTAMRDGLPAYVKPDAPQLKAVVDQAGQRFSAISSTDGWLNPETKQIIPGAVPYTANLQTGNPSDLSPTGTLANEVINERARIQGTVGTIEKLLDVMDAAAPRGGVFNIVARGRNWIGNAQQAVKEATAALPENMSVDEAKAWADNMAETLGADHDPAVRQAMNLYTDFIYQMARRANPRGEVGRYSLEQALDTWGLNDFITGNDAQIRGLLSNALDLSQQDWAVNEGKLAEQPQFDPSSIGLLRERTKTAPAAPQRPSSQATPAAPGRVRYDAQGNRVE